MLKIREKKNCQKFYFYYNYKRIIKFLVFKCKQCLNLMIPYLISLCGCMGFNALQLTVTDVCRVRAANRDAGFRDDRWVLGRTSTAAQRRSIDYQDQQPSRVMDR